MGGLAEYSRGLTKKTPAGVFYLVILLSQQLNTAVNLAGYNRTTVQGVT